jgi:hypothetical protein
MDQNGILSIVAIAVSIGGTILAIFNHRRVRSHCCGKDIVASIDVESTTPPNDDLKIKIPVKPEMSVNRVMMFLVILEDFLLVLGKC